MLSYAEIFRNCIVIQPMELPRDIYKKISDNIAEEIMANEDRIILDILQKIELDDEENEEDRGGLKYLK